jgi:hypothetical protein
MRKYRESNRGYLKMCDAHRCLQNISVGTIVNCLYKFKDIKIQEDNMYLLKKEKKLNGGFKMI